MAKKGKVYTDAIDIARLKKVLPKPKQRPTAINPTKITLVKTLDAVLDAWAQVYTLHHRKRLNFTKPTDSVETKLYHEARALARKVIPYENR